MVFALSLIGTPFITMEARNIVQPNLTAMDLPNLCSG